ncbi:MAG: hypothetical protein ABT940_11590 [Alphaproteobacteria bacterium]
MTGQVIRLRRSSVANAVPAPSDLVDGEFAFNLADKRLFAKDAAGNVVDIGGSSYALVDSPAFTGTPTTPTAPDGSHDLTIANTAFVKKALDKAIAGLDFQRDVLAVQRDGSLDPGATPAVGDRYIVTNPAALNAHFGSIANVAANDIVEFNGTAFIVNYAVAAAGPGALAWDRALARWLRWDGTVWDVFGGLSGVSGGYGITVTGDTIVLSLDKLSDLGTAAETDDMVAITDTSNGNATMRVSVQNLIAKAVIDGGAY